MLVNDRTSHDTGITTQNNSSFDNTFHTTANETNLAFHSQVHGNLGYSLETKTSHTPQIDRLYVFCSDYIRLIIIQRLTLYFQEADGFIAQLDKYKLLSWYNDIKEQLLDEFSIRIAALLAESSVGMGSDAYKNVVAMITAYQAAHYKSVEAGLLLVEYSASERKSLVVVNQSGGRHIQNHFTYDKVRVLKNWFYQHWAHPFPDMAEKQALTEESGLDLGQVQSWFINWRDRNWKTVRTELSDRKDKLDKDLESLNELINTCYSKYLEQRMERIDTLIELQQAKEDCSNILNYKGMNMDVFPDNINRATLYDDSLSLADMITEVCDNVSRSSTTLAFLPKDKLVEMEGR